MMSNVRATGATPLASGCASAVYDAQGRCAVSGSSNFFTHDGLSYANGVFTGNVVMNQCSPHAYGLVDGTLHPSFADASSYTIRASEPTCQQQTFPDPAFAAKAAAGDVQEVPVLGRIGLSVKGVNIYSPFEAGFTAGQASCAAGSCAGGIDVVACEEQLEHQCNGDVKYDMLMDTCGGHATPYHTHVDLKCDYDHAAPGHSPLVGIALDGRGIYGVHESTGAPPADLDACGGHVGPVPKDNAFGVPEGTEVYHYHLQATNPHTLGCFGKSDGTTTLAQCKAAYGSTCGTGFEVMLDKQGGQYCYDAYCPCYDAQGRNTDVAIAAGTCPDNGPGDFDGQQQFSAAGTARPVMGVAAAAAAIGLLAASAFA